MLQSQGTAIFRNEELVGHRRAKSATPETLGFQSSNQPFSVSLRQHEPTDSRKLIPLMTPKVDFK
jgi:hypothetical protein